MGLKKKNKRKKEVVRVPDPKKLHGDYSHSVDQKGYFKRHL